MIRVLSLILFSMSPLPGIIYLFGQLPNLVFPPLAVYCAKLRAELWFGISVSPCFTMAASILSDPAALTAFVQYRD